MSGHRPLSDWIATVTIGPDGIARRVPGIRLNDGDERADARTLPRFEDGGWQRIALPVRGSHSGYQTLALIRPGTVEAVVELDDLAEPLPISAEGIAVIERFERVWPAVTPEPGDLDVLRGESVAVRFALLDRLAEEGEPPHELFHVLPWEWVRTLAVDVVAAMDGRAAASTVKLRHWFTPAGPPFTSALEQLHAGLRLEDAVVARQGGAALCRRLLGFQVARLPEDARVALGQVVDRLPTLDIFLRHPASNVAALLSGGGYGPVSREMASTLRAAASGKQGREHSEQLTVGPFEIELTVTAQGALVVVAEATLSAAQVEDATARYGTVVLRMVLHTDTEHVGYLLPLYPTDLGLGATIIVRPSDDQFRVEFGEPPLGATETTAFDGDEVSRSIAAADHATLNAWLRLAEQARFGEHIRHAVEERLT